MAQTNFTPILTYKSDTATTVPSAGNLTNSTNGAELAVNTADKRLFTKDSGGNVVEVGTNPSSVTLPNGSANGVLYLNGSKVVTSGSALQFDGGANLSTGGSNASTYNTLNVNNTASNGYSRLLFNIGSSGANGIGVIKYAPSLFFAIGTESDASSTPITFLLNNAEQMRLTSTGLGIGTSSPSSKLDVSTSGTTVVTIGTGNSYGLLIYKNGGTEKWRVGLNGYNNYTLRYADSTDVLVADTSGNLGLGVTPSAWGSTDRAFQVGNTVSLFRDGAANAYFAYNNYLNSSSQFIYSNNGFASSYFQGGGQHQWFIAPSGTAGNAITFSQVMTLDASGRLGVGVTSPSTILDVGANDNTPKTITLRYSTVPTYLSSTFDGADGLSTFSINAYNTSSGSASWSAFSNDLYACSAIQLASGSGSSIRFLTAAAVNTNPSERARIDSSGNLLVGLTTNSAGSKLTSAGGIGTVNTASGRFSTVEYGSGASGAFTTITIAFTVDNTPASVILEVLMTGYDTVYLDHVAARYGNLSSVVMRNNASSGTTVSSLVNSGAGLIYTLTITTAVTHPVVKIKATSGGLASGFTNSTLPTINFT